MQAALEGAGEIGFTIVSISISLVAVFIPLFLMSGIVGLLFREFAVTVAVSIVVSVIVSLTLTPMMCARVLTAEDETPPGVLSRGLERFFERYLRQPLFPKVHEDYVYREAMQPCGKRRVSTERSDLTVELEKCFLCQVFRFGNIAEHAQA